jgi:hypothetical protein
MAAQYPTNVVSFSPSTVTDFTTTILAAHVNTLREEVIALQSNLGTLIKTGSGWIGTFDQVTSSWDSLKDRLANIEYGLNDVWTAVPDGGTTGQVLAKSSGSDYATAWVTVDALPSQSGNDGKYLTTDGSSASWSDVTASGADSISAFLLAGC